MRIITFCIAVISMSALKAAAQDTSRPRTVNVTSTFKPVLKEAAKINFNASPPPVDTTRPRLQYRIPNQNLLFAFQPGSLRPMALGVDTGGRWDNWNYAKLGYGTLKTPYFETGLSLGDGNTAGLNIYGRHISSKGKIEFQDYANTDVTLNGFIKTGKNLEWTGRFRASEDRYKKYGFQPKTLVFPEDSIEVNFQNWGVDLGLRNISRTELGLSFYPQVKVDVFRDGGKNRETNAYFHVPVRKTLGGQWEADVSLEGNLTRYTPLSKETISNDYFSIAPSVLVRTPNVFVNAGLRPSWDNGEFKLLPNIMVEIGSPTNKQVTLHGGWVGSLRSNTYRSFAQYNPWIWAPGFSNNSRIVEAYGGLKGAVTDHFNYNVRASYTTYSNLQFYVNDSVAGGKSFMVLNNPDVNALGVNGEFGYTKGEKFQLRTNLNIKKYFSIDRVLANDEEKPWGLPSLEFRTSLRFQIINDLFLKSDLYAFDAPWYWTKTDMGKKNGALDLSAGLEFAVVKNVRLWAQFNNILNNEYERWHQYPVYGFNFLGGVVFSFAKNNQ